jgi:hypothetical protein
MNSEARGTQPRWSTLVRRGLQLLHALYELLRGFQAAHDASKGELLHQPLVSMRLGRSTRVEPGLSADNSLTLIAQGSIQPFHKEGYDIKTREMRLHALPWPTDALADLQNTEVTLRVTLSYFVEPNPGARGWSTKYGYQSHGLRFDVKRASETLGQFQQRINKAARDEDYDDDPINETGTWLFKGNQTLSALGSVRSNVWTGRAVDLAARGHITIYPTYGWWNKRPNLQGYEKSSHYALMVTITTPETDIYTPVATAINIPILIET